MKKRFILLLCAMSIIASLCWGQTWKLTETMTATLEDHVLTISTTLDAEDMRDYDWIRENWVEKRSEIHSIVIEDHITGIFEWAFSHTPNVTTVTIANSVTYIGDYAFYNCYNLESVQLPEGLETLGHAAFKFCERLKSLDFPASVSVIGRETGVGCSHLEAINVHPDNTFFSSEDGVLYNKEKTTLLVYPEGKKSNTFEIPNTVKIIESSAFDHALFEEISIPNSVEEIWAGAFSTCTNLQSITIPSSVKTICEGIVAFCENLTSIQVDADNDYFTSEDDILYSKDKSLLHSFAPGKTGDFQIPSFVQIINYWAFAGSNGLTSITIPNTVTEIRSWAFVNCKNLTSLTIPYAVTLFGGCVFGGCIGLKDIFVEWEKPLDIDAALFKDIDITDMTLHVPTGTLESYEEAEIWQTFGTIIEYEYDFSNNEKVVTSTLKTYTSNGVLYITGLNPGKPLSIYSLTGQLLYHGIASSSAMQIPFPWRGVCIVVSEKQTTKVFAN